MERPNATRIALCVKTGRLIVQQRARQDARVWPEPRSLTRHSVIRGMQAARTAGVRDPDCVQLAALGAAIALGALDPDEAVFVRVHQRSCRARHVEVREALELAALIAASLREPRRPSGALRERLLAAARDAPGGG